MLASAIPPSQKVMRLQIMKVPRVCEFDSVMSAFTCLRINFIVRSDTFSRCLVTGKDACIGMWYPVVD